MKLTMKNLSIKTLFTLLLPFAIIPSSTQADFFAAGDKAALISAMIGAAIGMTEGAKVAKMVKKTSAMIGAAIGMTEGGAPAAIEETIEAGVVMRVKKGRKD